MIYKKYTFTFMFPITCYGEIITSDVVYATDLKKALAILKKEHHYARVKETTIHTVELYKDVGREVTLSKQRNTGCFNEHVG